MKPYNSDGIYYDPQRKMKLGRGVLPSGAHVIVKGGQRGEVWWGGTPTMVIHFDGKETGDRFSPADIEATDANQV